MDKFKKYILDQQFCPGFLGLFINPFFISRRELVKALCSNSQHIEGKTLDVGCGHRPYEKIFTKANPYIGIEYDSPKNRARFKKIDFWYDGTRFPFPDNSFDAIILTQVFEHVFNPDDFLREIQRVLRNKKNLLLSVPFVWDEHEQPNDFARYSSFALVHMLRKNGFEVINQSKTTPDIRVIFQLAACYVHKKISWIQSYRTRVCLYVILISPITIMGQLLSYILPKNQDLYLDNVILARKR